jgi:hypothetical protein
MSASGSGIVGVFFYVDDVRVYDTVVPYEHAVDPLTLSKGTHQLRIEVQGVVTSVDKIATITVVRVRPTVAEMSAAIAALQPGEWYEIPETSMRDIDLPLDERIVHGNQASIIDAASGGAYDTKRDRYIAWGGGSGSWRNEVNVFDMNTFEWNRLNDPSDFPAGGEGNALALVTHPDGAPVARHSFSTVQYIPEPVDRLYVGGGDPESPSGLLRDYKTYLFDFDTLTWTPGVETPSVGTGSTSAVGPDNRVWQHGGGGGPANRLSAIDVVAQTATPHVEYGGWFSYYATSDIHPVRNELVSIDDGNTRVWDLDNPDAPVVILPTSGDTEIEDTLARGFAYHPPTGLFVAWGGGKDAYSLDVATGVWTRVPGQGTTDPGPQSTRGTYNRWRFVPSRNVFIVANSVDRNVFVYRFQ